MKVQVILNSRVLGMRQNRKVHHSLSVVESYLKSLLLIMDQYYIVPADLLNYASMIYSFNKHLLNTY